MKLKCNVSHEILWELLMMLHQRRCCCCFRFACTHKMHKLKCCAEELCFLPHHVPLHCKLAFGWQAVMPAWRPPNPAMIQFVILEKRSPKAEIFVLLFILHIGLPLRPLNSTRNLSPDTAVKFTPAWHLTWGTSPKSPKTESQALACRVRANSAHPPWLCLPISWMGFLNNYFWDQQMKQNKAEIL